MYHVYALFGGNGEHPFYIGCSKNPEQRFSCHLSSKSRDGLVSNRIREYGDTVCLKVLSSHPNRWDALAKERETIKFYRSIGVDLLNKIHNDDKVVSEITKTYPVSAEEMGTYEAHRAYIGMSQGELCKSLGIQISTYFRWRVRGTTVKNKERIRFALRNFAKKYRFKVALP